MKRPLAFIFLSLAGLALVVALVYAVLVVAQVSDPAATTVRGMTRRRAWATASAAVALASVVGAGWSRLPARREKPKTRRSAAAFAVAAGAIAALSGALNVATANGGPGSGNGVVGGAVAVVLGPFAILLGKWRRREP